MKPTITVVLLAALALAGCSSLPDSVRGPHARAGAGHTQSDADEQRPAASPYPQVTDQGKF
jgi:starvation-inducible outer membrane lipoprotein